MCTMAWRLAVWTEYIWGDERLLFLPLQAFTLTVSSVGRSLGRRVPALPSAFSWWAVGSLLTFMMSSRQASSRIINCFIRPSVLSSAFTFPDLPSENAWASKGWMLGAGVVRSGTPLLRQED